MAGGVAFDGVVEELDGGFLCLGPVGPRFQGEPPGGPAGDAEMGEAEEFVAGVEGAVAFIEICEVAVDVAGGGYG